MNTCEHEHTHTRTPYLQLAGYLIFSPVFLSLVSQKQNQYWAAMHATATRTTLSREVGLSMTYLVCPCIFSDHEASHVTCTRTRYGNWSPPYQLSRDYLVVMLNLLPPMPSRGVRNRSILTNINGDIFRLHSSLNRRARVEDGGRAKVDVRHPLTLILPCFG